MIYIENSGVRFGPPAVMARITRGEPVDPADVYSRSTPRLNRRDGPPVADETTLHRHWRPVSGPRRPVCLRGRIA